MSVQYISRGVLPSRNISRPVVWSICASMRTTERTAVSRIARAGWRSGKPRNCVRISGDALKSTQFVLSAEIAIDDCVRAFALIVPLRNPSQLGQLQFHCGNPPPAPEPSTLIRIANIFRDVRLICDAEKTKAPVRGFRSVRRRD